MTMELISKKDLLKETNISYGQLYRWKRKDLIPEDWFIRKSTYTGQETFFPKEQILERIKKIQAMKENLSLDELAAMFSPNNSSHSFTKEEIQGTKLISETTLHFYLEEVTSIQEPFHFDCVLIMYLLEQLIQSRKTDLDLQKSVIHLCQTHYIEAEKKELQLVIIRKSDTFLSFITSKTDLLHFERDVEIISKIDFLNYATELKEKLQGGK